MFFGEFYVVLVTHEGSSLKIRFFRDALLLRSRQLEAGMCVQTILGDELDVIRSVLLF